MGVVFQRYHFSHSTPENPCFGRNVPQPKIQGEGFSHRFRICVQVVADPYETNVARLRNKTHFRMY